MFTGIISAVGTVSSLERAGQGARLRVEAEGKFLERTRPGDSLAVNGCCLTVTSVSAGRATFTADLSQETLERTSFARLGPGSAANLEHPLRVGDELGGHIVQGHVDGVGTVETLEPLAAVSAGAATDGEGGAAAGWWWRIRLPQQTAQYVVLKGSIAIDGISLTVAEIEADVVSFAIIPFTHSHTNLRTRAAGDPVNVEFDVIGRYVERLLGGYAATPGAPRRGSPRALERALRRQGF